MKRCRTAPIILFLLIGVTLAKNKPEPTLVMFWPNQQNPLLKLTFERFHQEGAYAGQISYATDVTVENMSGKSIPRASFTVYLLDNNKVRIGNGVLQVSDLGPGEQVKIAFPFNSTGVPASLSLVARSDSGGVPTSLKTISLNVISVPPGANLKVDGQEAGTTPKALQLTVGTHRLEFSKEGYATGTTFAEVGQDEMPGGSITFELGGLSRDTVELRDGKVVLGDVISVTMTDVVVRVEGSNQTYQRNQVKKIILVERETLQQPPVVQPAAGPSK